MDALFAFFAVHPVFTLYGMRVLWGAYILEQVFPFVAIVQNGHLSTASAGPLLGLFLRACLNLAIFRLLIDIAIALLFDASNDETDQRGGYAVRLADFFAVRPVFTLFGLRVLWGVYVLDQLLPLSAVLSNVKFTTAAIPAVLVLVLQIGVNLVLFRLLIEVAATVLPGRWRSHHAN
jgi:hypothetical protein